VILAGSGMEEATKGFVQPSQRFPGVSPEVRCIEFGPAPCDITIQE
jgi:hypothetical protein